MNIRISATLSDPFIEEYCRPPGRPSNHGKRDEKSCVFLSGEDVIVLVYGSI